MPAGGAGCSTAEIAFGRREEKDSVGTVLVSNACGKHKRNIRSCHLMQFNSCGL